MDIQQFCAQRNLPFGIIIDDLTAQNDDQYYNNTMNNLKFLQGIFGTNLGGMQVWRGNGEEGWRGGVARRSGKEGESENSHDLTETVYVVEL